MYCSDQEDLQHQTDGQHAEQATHSLEEALSLRVCTIKGGHYCSMCSNNNPAVCIFWLYCRIRNIHQAFSNADRKLHLLSKAIPGDDNAGRDTGKK